MTVATAIMPARAGTPAQQMYQFFSEFHKELFNMANNS
jgi:hypothetical protein